ncbi:hypothetical protein ACFX1T_046994 [Malus domestica]
MVPLSPNPLSSSIAAFDLLNSDIRTPNIFLIYMISAATFCCSLVVDTMNDSSSGQQNTSLYSRIISSSEFTFLIAYRTPMNPLNPLSFDSMETVSSNLSDNSWILISINPLFC